MLLTCLCAFHAKTCRKAHERTHMCQFVNQQYSNDLLVLERSDSSFKLLELLGIEFVTVMSGVSTIKHTRE